MDANPKFRVIESEPVGGDVIVTFGNGQVYLFPAHVLRAHVDEAEEVTDIPAADEPR